MTSSDIIRSYDTAEHKVSTVTDIKPVCFSLTSVQCALMLSPISPLEGFQEMRFPFY
jgi:hypothetical protein